MTSKCLSIWKIVMAAVTQWHSSHYSFLAEDLFHIGENLSGVRLMEALRKKLPGLMPSVTQDRNIKKASKKSFRDVLLPKRTATGFCVDPKRLLEVVLHKYHYLEWDVHIGLWDDGREIGGRHSVLIGMSATSCVVVEFPTKTPRTSFLWWCSMRETPGITWRRIWARMDSWISSSGSSLHASKCSSVATIYFCRIF